MLKKIFRYFLMISCAVPLFGVSIELIPDELSVTQIRSDVYVVTHNFPWESNSLILRTSVNNVILIDTPYTNDATEILYTWIQKEIDPTVIKCIVTGYHIDNIGGVAFLRSKNIEVLGTTLTNELIVSESDRTLRTLTGLLNSTTQRKYIDYYSKAKMVQTTKKIECKDTLTFKLDNLSLELFYPGESHAKDNITVYISNENILFGSCVIKSLESDNLGFIGDANLANWPKAVRKIQERYKSCRMVIPHHGAWGGKEVIAHTLDLFTVAQSNQLGGK